MAPTQSGPTSSTTFADLASAAGSQGGPGPGEGGAVGQNTDVAGGPANIGASVGFGPGQISIGPTGTISVGARGDSAITQGVSSALTSALNFAGIPTSVNVPSLVAALTAAPALGIAAQIAGAAGAPLTLAAIAHMFASMSPTSVTSLQAALADPNPETQLTLAQAMALAAGGAKGPTQGGVQAIGNLPFDNPVTNVNASTQAAPTTPAANLEEALTLTPTFAQLANALGFGRTDVTGGTAPPGVPAGLSSEGIDTGEGTPGGTAGPGPGDAGGAPGGSGDSPAM
jgi:hypothetical protein